MNHQELETYLLSMPGAWLDYPFGEGTAVYKVGHKDIPGQEEKMFALVAEGSQPLRVSLKCDPLLAQTLRERYESVQPGYHLNKKHWITVLCSGQLGDDEVKDLVRLSHQLVSK
ncbi:MAG TPA: MmcQ/YjbR family DNA-binding protein [Candidatus Saccharimonas sp.]|nr:MmcQ/YjbR family DNA-binding protein [Candidatus Saccharimonas sp.]